LVSFSLLICIIESKNCREIRGKSLGIVGYGHIGSQLSVLADAFGMNVYSYDILQIMPIGSARPVESLNELLSLCDFVSLHVPETVESKNMIGKAELGMMKKGSFLINASRGSVVDIPALAEALRSGHLGGSAIDVYPVEPFANGPNFVSELRNCPNTILTPHIGGSTEEAQYSIGIEVGSALVRYINAGCSLGAVNFPENDLRAINPESNVVRLLNIHQNVPGVLRQINKVLGDFNIEKQMCDSRKDIAYLMIDLQVTSTDDYEKIFNSLEDIPESIHTRLLY